MVRKLSQSGWREEFKCDVFNFKQWRLDNGRGWESMDKNKALGEGNKGQVYKVSQKVRGGTQTSNLQVLKENYHTQLMNDIKLSGWLFMISQFNTNALFFSPLVPFHFSLLALTTIYSYICICLSASPLLGQKLHEDRDHICYSQPPQHSAWYRDVP